MIVYSFSFRKNGVSPCNTRLALSAKRISESLEEPVVIFAQRTTASLLRKIGVPCYEVHKRVGYEGSEEVTEQAAKVFKKLGITEVIPVAQPFYQLIKCISLVRKYGFKTFSFFKLARLIGWIGFDRDSVQPWCRDPFRLTFYTIRQIFFGYHPPAELSE